MVEYIDFREDKPKKRIKGKIIFTKKEVIDIIKSWLVLSLAFTFVYVGFNFSLTGVYVFLASAFTVGIGFILHELGHKFTAERLGRDAHFVAFDAMLIMTLVVSFLGFIFFAPGGVFIGGGYIDRKKNGIISTFGPLVNIILALVFMPFYIFSPYNLILFFGFKINSWLALFNMLPFGNFDGRKIFDWSKLVYFSMAIGAGVMVFLV
ncbi:MAG: site-2 protease family protein [Candidatus Nanoarchaeia archaeon]|nr:site-2 protease family protein [Candidatus Nanoarchaeia archaeon]